MCVLYIQIRCPSNLIPEHIQREDGAQKHMYLVRTSQRLLFSRAIAHIRYCLPAAPMNTDGEPQATAELPLAVAVGRKHRFPRADMNYTRLVVAHVNYRDAHEGRCSFLLGLWLCLIATLSWDSAYTIHTQYMRGKCTDVAVVTGN